MSSGCSTPGPLAINQNQLLISRERQDKASPWLPWKGEEPPHWLAPPIKFIVRARHIVFSGGVGTWLHPFLYKCKDGHVLHIVPQGPSEAFSTICRAVHSLFPVYLCFCDSSARLSHQVKGAKSLKLHSAASLIPEAPVPVPHSFLSAQRSQYPEPLD